MTLRTVTYNPATHKIVPITPDYLMIKAALCGRVMPQSCDAVERIHQQMRSDLEAAISAAPEYQEPTKDE